MAVAAPIVVALVVLAFVWPTKTIEIKNLPISIAGPSTAVTPFEAALEKQMPGHFEFVAADSRIDAVAQIESRKTYGAVILAAPGSAPEVLTAPAASPTVAQLLGTFAQQLKAQTAAQVSAAGGDATKVQVNVTNIVPLASTDAMGTGLVAASFPLLLGGLIGGIITAFLVRGRTKKFAFLLGFSVVSGLLLTALLQGWLGFLQGDSLINAAAIAISVLGTAALIGGLNYLIGRPGLALGAAFTMLVANPLSSASAPWQFIAEPWGQFGQYLVPGSSNSLLRTLSYFPNADVSQQWLTLALWSAFGLVLLLVKKSE